MKTLKELQDALKSLNAEAEALEAKVAAEKDEAKRGALEALYTDKVAELEATAKSIEDFQAKTARKDRVAKLTTAPKVEDKSGDLGNEGGDGDLAGKTEIPDSEHNQAKEEAELDSAIWGYLKAPAKKATLFMANLSAKRGDLFMDRMKVSRDGKVMDGIKLPSTMRRFITGKVAEWSPRGLREVLSGKANEVLRTTDSSGTLTGGGSVVPDIFIAELYKLPQLQDRIMDLCFVKPAVGGTAYFPKLTQSSNRFGVTAYWGDNHEGHGESQHINKSNPTLTRDSVGTEQLSMLANLTTKELRVNNVGLEAELMWMMRGAFDQKVNQAILQLSDPNALSFTGVNTDVAIALGVVEVPRETAGAVGWRDLVRLQFGINSGSMLNGAYVMKDGSSGAMCALAETDDTNNRPVLQGLLNANWSGNVDQMPRIAGRRCIVTPDNDFGTGYRGDVIYGSWADYLVALDQDITIDRSDEFAFDRAVITYRLLAYLGGKPRGYTCFSVLGDVSSASSSSHSSSSISQSYSSAADE